MEQLQPTDDQVLAARARVVDHWKRLFSILSGFAITMACLRAYSCWLAGDSSGLAQFIILMVTIPPIFHGMERSLDLRYLRPGSDIPGPGRLIADTTSLVLTGLFFLSLALSIPDWSQGNQQHVEALGRAFFVLFVAFLAFDALVLFLSRHRFVDEDPDRTVHEDLARLNLGIAFAIALVLPFRPGADWIVVIIATARSVADYWMSSRFLYPTDRLVRRPTSPS